MRLPGRSPTMLRVGQRLRAKNSMLANRNTRNGAGEGHPLAAHVGERQLAGMAQQHAGSCASACRRSRRSVSKACCASPRSDRSRRSTAVSPQVGQKAVAMSCLQVGQVQDRGFRSRRVPVRPARRSLRAAMRDDRANARRRLATASRTLANWRHSMIGFRSRSTQRSAARAGASRQDLRARRRHHSPGRTGRAAQRLPFYAIALGLALGVTMFAPMLGQASLALTMLDTGGRRRDHARLRRAGRRAPRAASPGSASTAFGLKGWPLALLGPGGRSSSSGSPSSPRSA